MQYFKNLSLLSYNCIIFFNSAFILILFNCQFSKILIYFKFYLNIALTLLVLLLLFKAILYLLSVNLAKAFSTTNIIT